MVARVLTAHIHPEKVSEISELYHKQSVPLLKQQKGFKNAYLLSDPSSGKVQSVLIWEAEADLQEYERGGAFKSVLSHFNPFITGSVVTEAYKVEVAD